MPHGKPLRVYNMEFPSLREACAVFEIGYTTVQRRIKEGYSILEALTKPITKQQISCKRGHLLTGENLRLKTYKGRTYRECRICTNEYRRNRRQQLKEQTNLGTNK